jgi:hypothetical protein
VRGVEIATSDIAFSAALNAAAAAAASARSCVRVGVTPADDEVDEIVDDTKTGAVEVEVESWMLVIFVSTLEAEDMVVYSIIII